MANYNFELDTNIKYGTYMDTCILCVKKAIAIKNQHPTIVKNDMMGHVESKVVAYINRAGEDIVLCEECLNDLALRLGNITNPPTIGETPAMDEDEVPNETPVVDETPAETPVVEATAPVETPVEATEKKKKVSKAKTKAE